MAEEIPSSNIQERAFRVGDKVKLKDYTKYSDYRSHKDQVATIDTLNNQESGGIWDCHLRWSDERGSSVLFNNLIPYPGDWDE